MAFLLVGFVALLDAYTVSGPRAFILVPEHGLVYKVADPAAWYLTSSDGTKPAVLEDASRQQSSCASDR